MKKFLIAAVLTTICLTGCNSPTVVCTLESTVNTELAAQFATIAGCTNQAALVSELQSLESDLNICPSSGPNKAIKGVIGDACLALLPLFESAVDANHIFVAGGCTLANGSAAALLTKACGLIPASHKTVSIRLK